MEIFKSTKTNFLVLLLVFTHVVSLQAQNKGFKVSYNATRLGDSCFQLTKAYAWQNGSVWSQTRINLSKDFKIYAKLNFGNVSSGADGMAFVIQYLGSNLGSAGEGLGFGAISPSLGIEFDSYQNPYDPPYDHAALVKNGNSQHQSSPSNTLQGPQIPLKTNGATVKDDKYYPVAIIWNASTKTITCSFDGVQKINKVVDLTKDIFKDSQYVYWGFTGATGGLSNNHFVCIDSFTVYYEGTCDIAFKKQVSPFYVCTPTTDTLRVTYNKFSNVAYKIKWSTGDTTEKIVKKIDYNNTKFQVSVTNKYGTCVDSVKFNIINPQLTIDTVFNTECSTKIKKFTVPGNWRYVTWNDNSTLTTRDLSTPGKYWVEAADKLNCKTSDTFDYVIKPDVLKIIQTSFSNPSCKNKADGTASILKTNRVSGISLSYFWSPNNQKNATATNLFKGDYSCLVTDSKGCTDSAKFTLSEPLDFSISLKTIKDITCNGLVNGMLEITTQNGFKPFQFSLNNGSKQTSTQFNNLAKGQYAIIANDSANCSDTIFAKIQEPDSLKVSITSFQGDCFGDSKGKIVAVGTGGISPYNWQPNPSTKLNFLIDTAYAEKIEILNLPSNTYTVKLTDKNGCNTQVNQYISPKENIQISIDTSIKFNIAEKTKVSVIITPKGNYSYTWSPEKIFGTQIHDSTPMIKLYDKGYIALTVMNENSCSKSINFEIPVKIPPVYFWFPTAFSPDDNSLNDGYGPIGNFDWADFQIYNRWGEKLFQSTPTIQLWDGNYNGKPCPEGIYIITARLKYDRFEQKRDGRTSFTLLR